MPQQGHGQYRMLAESLEISSVAISQIFKGDRHLTLEQAVVVAEHFHLNQIEKEYFITLVEIERAGTKALRELLLRRLGSMREQQNKLASRVQSETHMSDQTRSIFYSSWHYSAIRLATSIPGISSVEALAERFHLPMATAKKIVDFLLQEGLCVDEKNKLKMGAKRTYLDQESPFIARHHSNWRMKGMEKMIAPDKDEIFITSPMSLSKQLISEIRAEILEFAVKISDQVKPSPEEELACLNIDLFKF